MNHFLTETAVTHLGGNHYRGLVSGCWNIAANPNGGYLASIAIRAMQEALMNAPHNQAPGQRVHPHPASVTTHYLRPGLPGADCDIEVDIVRTGKSLSTATATLNQDGKPRLTMLAVFADLDLSVGVDASIDTPAPNIPGPQECEQRSGATQGIELPILDRLDTRLHPQHAKGGTNPTAELAGWIRLADGADPTAPALVLFADAFPPSPFTMLGVVGWVPTIELTVQVRRVPKPGWIMGQFVTEDLHNGRMVESGKLWDSSGALVAQSRQLGLVLNRD